MRGKEDVMNMIKAQIEEMYEYLEIYDAYNTLQDILETLSGCGCDCDYSEGVLGKLMNIIGLIRNCTITILIITTPVLQDCLITGRWITALKPSTCWG